jgi:glycosyltransferase involved in cell wall biosynthesis
MKTDKQSLVSPRITVGMPVYNEEAGVERAIQSVLAQSYRDFELLIFDNGSTDNTIKICETYRCSDPRVEVTARSLQVSPNLNFRELLAKAKGEFFVYLAGDDYWMADFLQETIQVLDQYPRSCAATVDVYFSESTNPGHHSNGTNTILGANVIRVIKYLDQQPTDNSRFYGLFRTSMLRRSFFMLRPDINFHAFDWGIMAVSLWCGPHIKIEKTLLIRQPTGPVDYLRRIEADNRGHLWLGLPLLPMSFYILRYISVWSWPFIFPSLIQLNLRKLKEYRASLS